VFHAFHATAWIFTAQTLSQMLSKKVKNFEACCCDECCEFVEKWAVANLVQGIE